MSPPKQCSASTCFNLHAGSILASLLSPESSSITDSSNQNARSISHTASALPIKSCTALLRLFRPYHPSITYPRGSHCFPWLYIHQYLPRSLDFDMALPCEVSEVDSREEDELGCTRCISLPELTDQHTGSVGDV